MKHLKIILPIILLFVMISLLVTPLPAMALTGTIVISPLTGSVGSIITLSGSGFTASSIYTIKIDTTSLVNGTITAGGVLTATNLPFPHLPVGNHTITVITANVGGVVQDTSNAILFSVVPHLNLATIYGQVGDIIGITGTGYKANSIVAIYFGGISIASVNSDISGSIVTNLTIPGRAKGDYTVAVTDSAANSATAIFTVNPSLSLSPASIVVGAQIVINGKGYSANSATKIFLDTTNVLTVTSNLNGSFTIDYTVPPRQAGSHNISATDLPGHAASSLFTITPSITINPSTFTTGSMVTANGIGFTATSAVNVFIDQQIRSSNNPTTDANGSFTLSNFQIPLLSAGNHTFSLQDNSGKTAGITFGVTPSVEIKPAIGASGATIQVTGKSFGAAKNLAFTFNGARVNTNPAVVTTDANGSFSAVFVIPPSFYGTHPITVSDGTFTATQNFTITATASISPISGIVGTSVTVTGNGFGSKSSVQIKYDRTITATVTADSNGIFSATINIPPGATGLHTLNATDGNVNLNYNFTISARLDITPSQGNIGTKINLTGNGFLANAKVALSYDNQEITAITTNDVGVFTAIIDTPSSLGGNHLLRASDGASNLTASFNMETLAPIAPLLKLPLDRAKTVSMALLQWQEVSDPSGITYKLQVSRDAAFASILIEKSNLTTPSYQLTETEKLNAVSKNQPYYWRVRAIDGASNESPWTTPQQFYVGLFIPNTVQYVFFGFAVLIAGLLGYLIGLRKHLRQKTSTIPGHPPDRPTPSI